MLMSFIGLSSAAIRLVQRLPHRLHLWTTAHSPPLPHPYGNGFHDPSAVCFPVPGLNIHMQAGQAVWAVVSVLASGTIRHHRPAADLTDKAVTARVGLIIPLFDFLTFVFSVHS